MRFIKKENSLAEKTLKGVAYVPISCIDAIFDLGVIMKKQGHPNYQQILFIDSATGTKFLCGSTIQPKQTEVYEGKEYPVCYLGISSYSHPFFTGSTSLVDTEGRVEKFNKRYARKPVEPVTEVKKEKKSKR